MAVGDAYATKAQYKAVFAKTTAANDAEIDRDLLAVSRTIERELKRFFNVDVADVARDYWAPTGGGQVMPEAENPWRYCKGSRELDIDDLVSLTSVLVDDNGDGTPETAYTVNSDFLLTPLNAPDGPEARPYLTLVLPEWSSKQAWPPGRLVRVTGKFGWPAVPKAIERACIELCGILRLESPRATNRIQEGMDAVIGTSRAAQTIITDLRRYYGRNSV